MYMIKKEPIKNSEALLPAVDDFLLHIQANNYSEETLYNYERDIETFEHFLIRELSSPLFENLSKSLLSNIRRILTHATD